MAAPSLTRLPLKSEEEEEEEEATELQTGRRERGLEPWTKKKAGGGPHGNVKPTLIHTVCDVATERRLGPPSTFGPQFDSSSLHIESNSIYQCAWTRPLRQYQPRSGLQIHNHRYMPVHLLTDYSSI